MKALEDLCTHYDLSVRNSVGGVVQFQYGDDMLDPACLEGDATPVEYVRSWTHACVRVHRFFGSVAADKQKVAKSSTRALYPYELFDIVKDIWPEGTGRESLLSDEVRYFPIMPLESVLSIRNGGTSGRAVTTSSERTRIFSSRKRSSSR